MTTLTALAQKFKTARVGYEVVHVFRPTANGTIVGLVPDAADGIVTSAAPYYVKTGMAEKVYIYVSVGPESSYVRADIAVDGDNARSLLTANGIGFIETHQASESVPAGSLIAIRFSNSNDTVWVFGATYLRKVHSGTVTLVVSTGPSTTASPTKSPTSVPTVEATLTLRCPPLRGPSPMS